MYDEEKQQTARETWMLELPPEKAANLGLGARQFRKREAPDMSNRSEWTDTPTDKQRKVQEPRNAEINEIDALKQIAIQKRDEQMEKLAETSEKRKPYSLLEMHQEKLKKQQKVNLLNYGINIFYVSLLNIMICLTYVINTFNHLFYGI